jgi:hypothetical protein
MQQAPAGSWVVYRPSDDPAFIHVRIIDPQRAGSVTVVRIFDAKGGKFVREQVHKPED